MALFICEIQCMTYDYPIFSAIPQPVIPLLWPVAIVGGLAQMVRLKNVQDKGAISTLIHKAPQTPTSSAVEAERL